MTRTAEEIVALFDGAGPEKTVSTRDAEMVYGPGFAGPFAEVRAMIEEAGPGRFQVGGHRYYSGLSRRRRTQRRKEIAKFGAMDWKDPRAYAGFATDRGVKTRKSRYSSSWSSMYPEAKSLEERARVTGVPVRFLRDSYNRGMAAWRTGHRPGATQQQWGYARVSSFLLGGKTHFTTDADLVRKAKAASAGARAWWKLIEKKGVMWRP